MGRVPTRVAAIACLLGPACSGGALDPADLESVSLHRETLLEEEVLAAVPAPEHRVIAATPAETWLLDPLATSPLGMGLGDASVTGAAATDSGELLLATSTDLLLWQDEQLSPLGLGPSLAGELREVRPHGEDLWLGSTAGLYLLRENSLMEIRADALALSGAFAPGGRIGERPVLWVSSLHSTLALDAESWQVVQALDGVVASSLAVDATGELWLVHEEELLHVDAQGGLEGPILDTPVRAVYADPGVEGVWVAAVDSLLHQREGSLRMVGSERIYNARVDAMGRLLVPGAFALERLTAGQAVGLLGLADGAVLEDDAEVQLLLSPSEGLLSAALEVDGERIELDPADPVGVLRASDWYDDKAHELRAVASWEDGGSARSASYSFSVAALGEVSWAGEIEPLYLDRCAICHSGDTETLLDSAELWQERFEDIYAMVESGAMPIGNTPLSDGELAMLQAWKDGGFP